MNKEHSLPKKNRSNNSLKRFLYTVLAAMPLYFSSGCQYLDKKVSKQYSNHQNPSYLYKELGLSDADARSTAPDGLLPNLSLAGKSLQEVIPSFASIRPIRGLRKLVINPLLYALNGIVTETLGVIPDAKSTRDLYGPRETLLFKNGVDNTAAYSLAIIGDPVKNTWKLGVSALLSEEGVPLTWRYGIARLTESITATPLNKKISRNLEERLIKDSSPGGVIGLSDGKLTLGAIPIVDLFTNRTRYKINENIRVPDYVEGTLKLNKRYFFNNFEDAIGYIHPEMTKADKPITDICEIEEILKSASRDTLLDDNRSHIMFLIREKLSQNYVVYSPKKTDIWRVFNLGKLGAIAWLIHIGVKNEGAECHAAPTPTPEPPPVDIGGETGGAGLQ